MSFLYKAGFSSTFMVLGLLVKLCGFDEKAVQQLPEAMTRIRLIMVALPIIVMAIIVALIWSYPLREEEVRKVREVLEERRLERQRGRE
jgi:Na+/melibiose symporter-like transporter